MQRFGSKRGLLLAMATSAAESMDACFDMVRAAHPSPLSALVAAATDITRYLDTPEEVANSLAFLQMDLSDPDFHRLMVISSRKMLEGYRRLLARGRRRRRARRVRHAAPGAGDLGRLRRVADWLGSIQTGNGGGLGPRRR